MWRAGLVMACPQGGGILMREGLCGPHPRPATGKNPARRETALCLWQRTVVPLSQTVAHREVGVEVQALGMA